MVNPVPSAKASPFIAPFVARCESPIAITPPHTIAMPAISETLTETAAHGHRIFLAVDYVEGLGIELTRFLARLPMPDSGTVRVLLLARFSGWWCIVSE